MPDGLTGDFAGLKQLENNLRRLAEIPSQAAKQSVEGLRKAIAESYATGKNPNKRPWAPLMPSTVARGRKPPPLTDTGDMRSTTEVKALPGAGVAITFGVPYAVFHHTGTKNMSARPVAPTGSFPASWNEILRSAVDAAVQRHLGSK
jgi:hypothetical protein